jgi:glycosyltransferase involved in cell wall biosynthesis
VTGYTRLLRDRGFTVAIFSRPEIAKGLLRSVRRRKPGIKIIFDMVDAYFVRLAREYSLTSDPRVAAQASRYKQMELQSIRASDLVWCASSADKTAVAREVPNVPIEVVPTIHPLRSRGKSFAEREHLFFVGHFGHRPNVDGVVYFLKEVFPLVRRFIPGVKVFIAGAKPPTEIQGLAAGDVDVMGYVPDIEPFFNGARVFVAPLRFGAGMKGKIGDALSYGLPVVTTSIGAEGMGVRHGQEAMIADEPAVFAEAVVDVYRDAELWQRLSDNGCIHVERNFSPQAIEQTIVDSINLKPQ